MRKYPEKILIVSSLDAGAGKSSISSNVAILFAQNGEKTLLIDCDLRLGTLCDIFGLHQCGGRFQS